MVTTNVGSIKVARIIKVSFKIILANLDKIFLIMKLNVTFVAVVSAKQIVTVMNLLLGYVN